MDKINPPSRMGFLKLIWRHFKFIIKNYKLLREETARISAYYITLHQIAKLLMRDKVAIPMSIVINELANLLVDGRNDEAEKLMEEIYFTVFKTDTIKTRSEVRSFLKDLDYSLLPRRDR